MGVLWVAFEVKWVRVLDGAVGIQCVGCECLARCHLRHILTTCATIEFAEHDDVTKVVGLAH